MSDRTSESLAILDRLLPALDALPAGIHRDQILDAAQALRRAVAAFHMEAIRFRMFSVDRLLRIEGEQGPIRAMFEELRQSLETAGFHTRSHTAP
jgi:2'-5' RNA ligase